MRWFGLFGAQLVLQIWPESQAASLRNLIGDKAYLWKASAGHEYSRRSRGVDKCCQLKDRVWLIEATSVLAEGIRDLLLTDWLFGLG